MNLIYLFGAYISYSLFITGFFIDKEYDKMRDKIKLITIEHNTQLYTEYQNKKITHEDYIRNKRSVTKEIRKSKRVNMIISPILAIPITLTLALKFLNGK